MQSSGRSGNSKEQNILDQNVDEFVKLRSDLEEVFEKVRLCREMLPNSPGIAAGDEALAEVIGYLEACRDRMVDLIEAGSQGLLGEDLFAMCLRCNDAVIRTLEAEQVRHKRAYHIISSYILLLLLLLLE